jgi:hypothetical protein
LPLPYKTKSLSSFVGFFQTAEKGKKTNDANSPEYLEVYWQKTSHPPPAWHSATSSPCNNCKGGCVGPRAGLGVVSKRKILSLSGIELGRQVLLLTEQP